MWKTPEFGKIALFMGVSSGFRGVILPIYARVWGGFRGSNFCEKRTWEIDPRKPPRITEFRETAKFRGFRGFSGVLGVSPRDPQKTPNFGFRDPLFWGSREGQILRFWGVPGGPSKTSKTDPPGTPGNGSNFDLFQVPKIRTRKGHLHTKGGSCHPLFIAKFS